jgi:hypothetical protein
MDQKMKLDDMVFQPKVCNFSDQNSTRANSTILFYGANVGALFANRSVSFLQYASPL